MASPPARDRDAAGHARNARPRDRLGRPLPRGSQGVPTVAEDTVLSVPDSIRQAQVYLDTDMPFHAHEVLEQAWKSSQGEQAQVLRAATQTAVGLTHWSRGNAKGARALWRRAHDSLGPLAPGSVPDARIAGLSVAGLLSWLDDALDNTGEQDLPRLVLLPPDGFS